MAASYSYTDVKTAMAATGLPVSEGAGWGPVDQASFEKYIVGAGYGKAYVDDYAANYGFAYTVAPTWLVDAISSGTP